MDRLKLISFLSCKFSMSGIHMRLKTPICPRSDGDFVVEMFCSIAPLEDRLFLTFFEVYGPFLSDNSSKLCLKVEPFIYNYIHWDWPTQIECLQITPPLPPSPIHVMACLSFPLSFSCLFNLCLGPRWGLLCYDILMHSVQPVSFKSFCPIF